MIPTRHQPSRRPGPVVPPRDRRPGFTLIELLVVVVIVILVSAATLPTVISALSNRQVGEAARSLQAAFAGARDEAIRANEPRGFRLLPDPTISSLATNGRLAANRFVAIEPAPALIDGYVTFPTRNAEWTAGVPPALPFPVNTSIPLANPNTNGSYPFPLVAGDPDPTQSILGIPTDRKVLMVVEARFDDNRGLVPNPFTNWFWNVRVGDKMRIGDSGALYTVVGPMTLFNPELYVNVGPPGTTPALIDTNYSQPTGNPVRVQPEFLFLVNGVDDNGDGYVDQGVNGVDENLNGTADDFLEWMPRTAAPIVYSAETERWLSPSLEQEFNRARSYPQTPGGAIPPIVDQPTPATFAYTVYRRPVVSPNAREVNLPAGAVVDLTTWNTTRERSRVPVNPFTGSVDVLINPTGELVPTTEFSTPASNPMGNAFFHFWIADREDVVEPFNGDPTTASYPNLPVPEGTAGYVRVPPVYLKKERQLLTFFARTGQVLNNTIEFFDLTDPNLPYRAGTFGLREAK